MFLILIAVTAVLIVYLNNYFLNYWNKRGFKQHEPSFLFGNMRSIITMKESMNECFDEIYRKYKKSKIVGLYMFYRPAVLVTDAKLVQDIFIKDFTSFHDRPLPVDEKTDPLSAHLFSIQGQQWRDLRVKLSPTFTSGKLKAMFSSINSVGKVLDDYLTRSYENKENVFEFRDLMARFNTNIISSVAFGIENDCINDPNHIFRRMGAKIFETNLTNGIKSILILLCPGFYLKLKLKFLSEEVEDFMRSIVKDTVNYRETKNITRNDFMQLLIELKNQGYLSVDKGEKNENAANEKNINKLNMDQLTANVILFFNAGFETSSSTMSFCLFEIARHPEVQQKIQAEIDEALQDSNGEFTYDNLSKLKYLECCIDEALRKYPIVPSLFRQATRDYKIRDSNLTIPKGTSVIIPTYSMHRDPEIYDDPMKFIPERFLDSPHGNGKVEGVFYTPFGDGPRNCIGMRLGKLTTKLGLALILKKFNVEHTNLEFLTKELEFIPQQFVLTPLKPFNLKITKRFD